MNMRSELRGYGSIDLTDRAMRWMLFWCSSRDRTGRRHRSGPSLCSDIFWLRDYHGLLWGDLLLLLLRLNPYVCRVPFASDCEIFTLRMLRLRWCRNGHSRGRIRCSILHIIFGPRLYGRHFFRSILFVLFIIIISVLAGRFLSDLAGRFRNSPFLQTTS